MPKDLIVVRGSYRGSDPVFNCVAHDTRPGHYVALDVTNGCVTRRRLYRAAERRAVETLLTDPSYEHVLVDRRNDPKLMSLSVPSRAMSADLDELMRAKSEEEKRVLASAAELTRRQLDEGNYRGFRGAKSAQMTPKSAGFRVKQGRGFTEYRGGFETPNGMHVDLTRVEARTPEWSQRLERVHRGLDAVADHGRIGVSVDTLNRIFLAHMNDDDRVYGSVLRHVGYGPQSSLPIDQIREHDVYTLGVSVGSTQHSEVATIYRGIAEFRRAPAETPRGDFRGTSEDRLFRGNQLGAWKNKMAEKVTNNFHKPSVYENDDDGDPFFKYKSWKALLNGVIPKNKDAKKITKLAQLWGRSLGATFATQQVDDLLTAKDVAGQRKQLQDLVSNEESLKFVRESSEFQLLRDALTDQAAAPATPAKKSSKETPPKTPPKTPPTTPPKPTGGQKPTGEKSITDKIAEAKARLAALREQQKSGSAAKTPPDSGTPSGSEAVMPPPVGKTPEELEAEAEEEEARRLAEAAAKEAAAARARKEEAAKKLKGLYLIIAAKGEKNELAKAKAEAEAKAAAEAEAKAEAEAEAAAAAEAEAEAAKEAAAMKLQGLYRMKKEQAELRRLQLELAEEEEAAAKAEAEAKAKAEAEAKAKKEADAKAAAEAEAKAKKEADAKAEAEAKAKAKKEADAKAEAEAKAKKAGEGKQVKELQGKLDELVQKVERMKAQNMTITPATPAKICFNYDDEMFDIFK